VNDSLQRVVARISKLGAQVRSYLHSELFRCALTYFLGAAFMKGISFLLIPMYTALLKPDEYGQLEIINNIASILSEIFCLGLTSVLFIEYYHHDESSRKILIRELITIFILISTPLYTITTIIIYLKPRL